MPQQSFLRPRRFKRRPRSRKPFNSSQVKAIKKLSVATQDMKEERSGLSTTDLTSGTSYYLSIDQLLIQQGTNSDERVADRITVKDFTFRTVLAMYQPISTLAHCNIRVLVVQFLDTKTVAVNSLFNGLGPESWLPTLEQTAGIRYKVLHDKIVPLAPFSPHKTLVHRVKASDLPIKDIEYVSNSTDILKGDIVYYLNSDYPVVHAGTGDMSAQSANKLRYYG